MIILITINVLIVMMMDVGFDGDHDDGGDNHDNNNV